MSELDQEQLDAVRQHYTCDEPDGMVVLAVRMARRTHDAEQRAQRAEAALRWIRDACDVERSQCLCGRPTGVDAIFTHASKALATPPPEKHQAPTIEELHEERNRWRDAALAARHGLILGADDPNDGESAQIALSMIDEAERVSDAHPTPEQTEGEPQLCPTCRQSDQPLAIYYICDGCERAWKEVENGHTDNIYAEPENAGDALERLRDGRDVPMPQSREHAEAMATVGLRYLDDNGGRNQQNGDALAAFDRIVCSARRIGDTALVRQALTTSGVPEEAWRLPEWMRRQWDDTQCAVVGNTCAHELERVLAAAPEAQADDASKRAQEDSILRRAGCCTECGEPTDECVCTPTSEQASGVPYVPDSAVDESVKAYMDFIGSKPDWSAMMIALNTARGYLTTNGSPYIPDEVRRIGEWARWSERYATDPVAVHIHSSYRKQLRKALASAPAVPDGKYTPFLGPFVRLMDAELHANAGKGDRQGWLSMSSDQAMLEIYYHAAKLQKAVRDGDGALIQEHSADVANMSMMLLDLCVGLTDMEDAAAPMHEGSE